VLYISLIACIFLPFGLVAQDASLGAEAVALLAYGAKVAVACVLLATFEMTTAKMRVFRVPNLLGIALMLGLLGTLLLFVSGGM
jgi:formate hydrogenlyase subunit 4